MTYPIGTHSDYASSLDQNASRARFIGHGAPGLMSIAVVPPPVAEILNGDRANWTWTTVAANNHLAKLHPSAFAGFLRDPVVGETTPGLKAEQRNAAATAATSARLFAAYEDRTPLRSPLPARRRPARQHRRRAG